MTRPYCHAVHDEACRICARYATDAAFRATIDRVKAPKDRRPQVVAPERPVCLHLGQKIAGQTVNCVRKCFHVCEAGFGQDGRTRPAVECPGCEHWQAEEPEGERPEPGFFDHVAVGPLESPAEFVPPARSLASVGFHFAHHGDLGDIIYALPSVKSLCVESGLTCRFYPYPRIGTRVTMTPQHAANLIPLLEAQDYIAAAQFSPLPVGVRLDAARRFAFKGPGLNIAEQYRQWLALPRFDRTKPWLKVEAAPVARVVFSRSPRYRPPGFPWKRIVEKLGREAVFVGTAEEHAAFCREAGEVSHYKTNTLLDVASVIAGCELFVGNQSCPRAIAEGLKVRVVVEESDQTPDTKFLRKGAWYGRREDFWCEALE